MICFITPENRYFWIKIARCQKSLICVEKETYVLLVTKNFVLTSNWKIVENMADSGIRTCEQPNHRATPYM